MDNIYVPLFFDNKSLLKTSEIVSIIDVEYLDKYFPENIIRKIKKLNIKGNKIKTIIFTKHKVNYFSTKTVEELVNVLNIEIAE